MKKKTYQKPTMQVVQLQQQCNILVGSQRSAKGENFTWDDEETPETGVLIP